MKLTEGQRFKLLADDLKETKGITRQILAQMIGVTPEYLSHTFRSKRKTNHSPTACSIAR